MCCRKQLARGLPPRFHDAPQNAAGPAAASSETTWRPFMSHPRRVRSSAFRVFFAAICVPAAIALTACGGGGGGSSLTIDSPPAPAEPAAPEQAASFDVAKAACGTGDKQETGLQGQVPVSAQVGG